MLLPSSPARDGSFGPLPQVVTAIQETFVAGSFPTKLADHVSRTVGLDRKTQGPFVEAPAMKTHESDSSNDRVSNEKSEPLGGDKTDCNCTGWL